MFDDMQKMMQRMQSLMDNSFGEAPLARPFLLPQIAEKPPLLVHQPLRQWPIDQPLPVHQVTSPLARSFPVSNFSEVADTALSSAGSNRFVLSNCHVSPQLKSITNNI